MSTTTSAVSADELFRMPDDGKRHELVRGELREMSPAGSEHGVVVVRLTRLLANHVEDRKLGLVFGAETGFVITQNPDTVRAPDVSFVCHQRIPADGIPKAFWPGAPDLAVEILSPGDRVSEVDDKVQDWLDAGTAMVWVVSPKWRTVTLYRASAAINTLSENDTLDGADVVPDFTCTVGEIFVN